MGVGRFRPQWTSGPDGVIAKMSDNADSLNQLSTNWGEIAAAQGDGPAAREAQCAVLRRYSRAVTGYLRGALGDPHAADDLAQEFALKFVRGDFHRLHPSRGRFRDFVKTVLFHLVADYYRGRKAEPKALPPGSDALLTDGPPAGVADDLAFARIWRGELLHRAWDELRHLQSRAGVPLYDVLQGRVEHPDERSAESAERLSALLGRPVSAEAFRQILHRARLKFAELLRMEVAFSLGTERTADLEQEMADLELLTYLRPLLSKHD